MYFSAIRKTTLLLSYSIFIYSQIACDDMKDDSDDSSETSEEGSQQGAVVPGTAGGGGSASPNGLESLSVFVFGNSLFVHEYTD